MNITDDVVYAAESLKQGLVVAFPTETVYGLGAPVFNASSVENVFRMKGRPADNPLICHISHIDQLPLLAQDIPPEAYLFASHFWPGSLTLILKKQQQVPMIVTGGLETVAVRMPRHPMALELIRLTGSPIVGPSANKSGKPSSTDAAHVLADFAEMLGIVLDGGHCVEGIESTVLNLTTEIPQILRPGMISQEELEKVLGRPIEINPTSHASPGTRYRHYAPSAEVHIYHTFDQVPPSSRKRFYMSTEAREGYHLLTPQTFYGLLRQADKKGTDEIIIVCKEQEHPGLQDRLCRAAGLIS